MNAMTHVANLVYRLHCKHMRLVVSEIRVGLYLCGHIFKSCAILQFHINHPAMNAFAQRDSHRKRILNPLLTAHAHAVSHAHARSEVGVRQTFGRQTLHQHAHDRVWTRVPSCRNNAHSAMFLTHRHQFRTIVQYVRVDVKAIYRVYPHSQILLGVCRALARRQSQDSHIHFM